MADKLTRTVEEQNRVAEALSNATTDVWGYVRVSSEGQEDNQSPEVQEEAIIAYAKEMKLSRPIIIRETASAGKPILQVSLPNVPNKKGTGPEVNPRPLFLMLLAHLSDHSGHLIVWRLDRLARLQTEQEMFLDLLWRNKVHVHSVQATERTLVNGGTDGIDPARVFFRQIMGAVAEYERKVIALRTSAGAFRKAQKGGWTRGMAPHGYTNHERDLLIDPEDAKSIRWIFYLRDQCSLTYREIEDRLTAMGFPGWYKVRISRTLATRKLYNGIYEDPYGVDHHRPDLKIIPDDWTEWIEQCQSAASLPIPPKSDDLTEDLSGAPSYGKDR